ncbi:30S ribosomal protein S5 [Mycoplasma sp. M5725]|uniref:Small ribosomal subunit protein uS5 n=1 Tax=Mycoplasma phocimorsus TaxID=3045839 RepID=A0AAJ1PSA3_9MOLU|nr:30S ribosomal protein S5 [Mycoplasma phocimorsus]MDJ1645803.1 30S ribosomal protein S5 [Mycoplasma phocimorsus]MDJ1648338.1 30S ribosomal protein S5 [Mycoplasma phocimorsus]MDJ1648887.1 30S ribosomal protein S5 [Mycoplasma phocimorsus]
MEETKASSASATKVVEVKTEKKSSQNTNNKQQRARKGSSRNTKPVKDEFEEKVIDIARVVKVVKGGRNFSFSAFVVVGNKKGKVGYGHGKAKEVPDAIKKAVKDAKNHLVDVPLIKDSTTIPHEITEKFLASKVILKPAPKGKGIIASGSVRAVIELAGYHDIVTKTYGSRTKANVVKATLKALRELRTPEEIAALRDKKVSDII